MKERKTKTALMTKAYVYMAVVLVGAAAVTLTVGEPVLNLHKAAGLGLAMVTVLPVFFMLIRAMNTAETRKVLIIFVGGFFFKLIVLLIGIWLGLAKVGWEITSFTVGCLAFVFAFQICESIYFWAKKDYLN